MSDRRVFESLCLEPNRAGYSYDSELLVDVDRAYDFDEAVIRLITKCNSIVTQFHTLGHHFSEFSVAYAKVQGATSSPIAASNGKNRPELAMHQKMASTTSDSRNLKFMEVEWRRLKRKKYNGMVAVSRISRSSIPRNGAGGKYSVKEYTETLLGHIQGYFMFKSYCPTFERWTRTDAGENGPQVSANESADDEYLVYLVYRLHVPHLPQRPKTPTRPRWSELEKLDLHWPFGQSKHRHTSGESSVSSCSSSSSTPSGGPTYLTPPTKPAHLTPPTKPAPHEEARRRSNRIKTPDPISPDWEMASVPPALASPTFSTDEEADPFNKTPRRVSSNRRRLSSTQNTSSPYVEADLFHKTPARISTNERTLSSSSSTSTSSQSERTRSSPRLRNKTGE